MQGDHVSRTFLEEVNALQHFQAGNSTNDACYSWVFSWLAPRSQVMVSSLHSDQIQQLESFLNYHHGQALPADDPTQGAMH